ncbi:MAG: SDR family oxidoreductase [Halobacteriaceae archaeon]
MALAPADLDGRVALVTGGTSGVGRATARRLAELGATVFVTGRDPTRGEAVATELAGDATFLRADFADFGAVRGVAEAVRDRTDRLDVLVNNAGTTHAERRLTADGYEQTFAVNHLAHFLLTHRLADRLVESVPARVVTVASAVHTRGDLDLDAVTAEENPDYDALDAYARSKLANVLFAYELADRLGDTGVTSTAVHPGFVPGSRIWRHASLRVRLAVRAADLLPFVGISAAEAGRRVAVLGASPDVADVTGQYFEGTDPAQPSPGALDSDLRARLWAWSAEAVDVAPDLPVA